MNNRNTKSSQNFLIGYIFTLNLMKLIFLLISGDIFDTGVPSTQSQKLYYDFLINIKSTSCKHIIITGGNHDAPGDS